MGEYDDKLNLVLFESMKLDKPWTLQTYRSIGGYDIWEKYLREKPTRESIIDAVKASGLRGRGGAAFPTGTKWSFMPRNSPIQVYEVAAFYSMFETHPCGRHHVSICTNVSCMLNGGEELVAHAEKKLGIKLNESTPDGRIFLKREEECLAACTGAPMAMVDHVFHEWLTPEKLDKILDELK